LYLVFEIQFFACDAIAPLQADIQCDLVAVIGQ